jgi:hypothetical protein
MPRDWDRFRNLCRDSARFLLARVHADGAPATAEWDLEGFMAEGARQFARTGLWGTEVGRHVERFGRVAHVFSAYEARVGMADAPVAARGVNSIQLVCDDGVWQIAHVAWDTERSGNPLPTDLLRRDD